jgi:hypothetical protein
MRFKRAFFCFSLALLMTSFGGCVYLRLLEVKLQLVDFEKYFKIEQRNGLSLVCLKPVLSTQDISALAKRGPTFAEAGAPQTVWQYHFTKQYHHPESEKGIFDVPVVLVFQKDKLCMGTLPERFCEVMPRAFIIEAFRAIGRAEVNPIDRSAKGPFFERAKDKGIPIPKSHDFVRLLGKPFAEEKSGAVTIFTFVYRLQRGSQDPAPPTDAWARFSFLQGGEKLLKIEAKFAGMKLTLSFENTEE